MLSVWETVFELLFKYRPIVFEKGRLVLSFPGQAVLVLAALSAAAVLTYGLARGRTGPAHRLLLAGLRALALVAVLFALCRPALRLATVVPQQSFVGILLDDSKSLRIADGDEPRSAFVGRAFGGGRRSLLRSLEDRFKVRFFRFSATAERIDAASDLGFDGARTDLAAALDRARQELAAVPLAGLVLVSDGADNGGAAIGDSLAALRARSLPVFTVGLGREAFARDVELLRVQAPRSVLKGSSLVVEVRISQHGFSGEPLTLQVEDSGRLMHTEELTLSREGEAAVARVHLTTDEAGPRVFRFRVPPRESETVVENNERAVLIRVDDRREKILYLEGEPRFEVGFLRRAVAGDPNLQVVTLERTSPNRFLRLDVDDADELASGFPETPEELFRYRGLVLGSVEAGFFSPGQLRLLADFVAVRGGGLLALGGRLSLAEGGYAGTPLAGALPVALEPRNGGAPERVLDAVRVEPTTVGLAHGVTQLGSTGEGVAEAWARLPSLSLLNRVGRAKPGAEMLLVGRSAEAEDQVVLASQRYGRGKAIAFTLHDTWRWKMDAAIPKDDRTHETLWRQLLRWVVAQVPDPVTLLAPDDVVPSGALVPLRVQVRDGAFLEVNDADVSATVTDPEGAKRDLRLEWNVEKDGEYRGAFRTEAQGLYEVQAEARRGDDVLGTGVAYVRAGDSDAEYHGAERGTALLTRIARETGGRFYTPETVGTLPEDLRYSGAGATVVEEKELWDMPALYLAVLSLVSAEWTLRRRRGLA
jgi:uncharacterized membrane protein